MASHVDLINKESSKVAIADISDKLMMLKTRKVVRTIDIMQNDIRSTSVVMTKQNQHDQLDIRKIVQLRTG